MTADMTAKESFGSTRRLGGWASRAGVAFMVTGAVLWGAQAHAREWVNPDVFALREEVERLSNEVAAIRTGAPTPRGGEATRDGSAPALSGDVYVRLERLDQAVRSLTGAVEQLDRFSRQSAQRQDAKLQELEFRLTQLEGGTPAAPSGEASFGGG
ncbi:MAG: hypothetical protein AAF909_09550, partial [Pseudomonadota bacterium]